MEKLKKLLRNYREGGSSQAIGVTLRRFFGGTRLKPLLDGIVEMGWRHGIPYGVGVFMLKLLPEDGSGTNVFESEWDVLVVLDTCRPEWIETVQSEYGFIEEIDTIRSVGARTSEWVTRTFIEDKLDDRDVYYLFGCKYGFFGEKTPSVERIRVVSDDFQYPPAHLMTDRALDIINQDEEHSRIVIHYSQPHLPVYIANGSRSEVEVLDDSDGGPLEAYSKGVEKLEVLHLNNLRYVMDEVETLIDGIDGQDIVLTADHGQMLGEHFIVGHPHGLRHDAVRNVPWIRI